MRKWMWGLSALLVCGAFAAYWTAAYAVIYPESFVGRCVLSVTLVGSRCSPLLALGHGAARPGKPVDQAGNCVAMPEAPQAVPGVADDVVEPIVLDGPQALPTADPATIEE